MIFCDSIYINRSLNLTIRSKIIFFVENTWTRSPQQGFGKSKATAMAISTIRIDRVQPKPANELVSISAS